MEIGVYTHTRIECFIGEYLQGLASSGSLEAIKTIFDCLRGIYGHVEEYKMIKSKEEMEFDKLSRQIRKKLKQGYGITPGDSRPLSEHIRIMKEALKTGVLPPPVKEGIVGFM